MYVYCFFFSKCILHFFFFFLQTPNSKLGVALQFENYALKPEDIKGCESGWWRVNEVMYVVAASPQRTFGHLELGLMIFWKPTSSFTDSAACT